VTDVKRINWIDRLFRRRPPSDPRRRTSNLDELAEQVRVEHPAGPTGMSLRPSGTDSDVGQEFGYYAGEQTDKHGADGIRASQASTEEAAALAFQAKAARQRARGNQARFTAVQEQHDHAQRWLLPLTHRAPGAHRLYLTWFVLLMFGDAAGVFGASILWGELIPTAIGQALAAGAAAVAAGWVGADVRERRDAKARAALASSGKLRKQLRRRYPSLFAPVPLERDTYGVLLAVAVVIVICLGAAIFALRAAVEASLLAGFIFGGLAVATALGSFINSWHHADQVADLLDRYSALYENAVREQQALDTASVISRRGAAKQRAAQQQAYHETLGNAAMQHVLALKYGVHRRNPEVFGHGTAKSRVVEVASRPIGRRTRQLVGDPSVHDAEGLQHIENYPVFPFEGWTSPGDSPF